MATSLHPQFSVVKEFIILLKDELTNFFLNENEVRSVSNITNCYIELTNRLLNRKIGDYKILKYVIVRIQGRDAAAIRQCNRLIEKRCPMYRYRQEYTKRQNCCTIYNDEMTPDNTQLYFHSQRSGTSTSQFGRLIVKSPFEATAKRPLSECYWKSNVSDLSKGILVTSGGQGANYMENYMKTNISEKEPGNNNLYYGTFREGFEQSAPNETEGDIQCEKGSNFNDYSDQKNYYFNKSSFAKGQKKAYSSLSHSKTEMEKLKNRLEVNCYQLNKKKDLITEQFVKANSINKGLSTQSSKMSSEKVGKNVICSINEEQVEPKNSEIEATEKLLNILEKSPDISYSATENTVEKNKKIQEESVKWGVSHPKIMENYGKIYADEVYEHVMFDEAYKAQQQQFAVSNKYEEVQPDQVEERYDKKDLFSTATNIADMATMSAGEIINISCEQIDNAIVEVILIDTNCTIEEETIRSFQRSRTNPSAESSIKKGENISVRKYSLEKSKVSSENDLLKHKKESVNSDSKEKLNKHRNISESLNSKNIVQSVNSKNKAESVNSKNIAESVNSKNIAESVNSKNIAESVNSKNKAESVNSKNLTDKSTSTNLRNSKESKPDLTTKTDSRKFSSSNEKESKSGISTKSDKKVFNSNEKESRSGISSKPGSDVIPNSRLQSDNSKSRNSNVKSNKPEDITKSESIAMDKSNLKQSNLSKNIKFDSNKNEDEKFSHKISNINENLDSKSKDGLSYTKENSMKNIDNKESVTKRKMKSSETGSIGESKTSKERSINVPVNDKDNSEVQSAKTSIVTAIHRFSNGQLPKDLNVCVGKSSHSSDSLKLDYLRERELQRTIITTSVKRVSSSSNESADKLSPKSSSLHERRLSNTIKNITAVKRLSHRGSEGSKRVSVDYKNAKLSENKDKIETIEEKVQTRNHVTENFEENINMPILSTENTVEIIRSSTNGIVKEDDNLEGRYEVRRKSFVIMDSATVQQLDEITSRSQGVTVTHSKENSETGYEHSLHDIENSGVIKYDNLMKQSNDLYTPLSSVAEAIQDNEKPNEKSENVKNQNILSGKNEDIQQETYDIKKSNNVNVKDSTEIPVSDNVGSTNIKHENSQTYVSEFDTEKSDRTLVYDIENIRRDSDGNVVTVKAHIRNDQIENVQLDIVMKQNEDENEEEEEEEELISREENQIATYANEDSAKEGVQTTDNVELGETSKGVNSPFGVSSQLGASSENMEMKNPQQPIQDTIEVDVNSTTDYSQHSDNKSDKIDIIQANIDETTNQDVANKTAEEKESNFSDMKNQDEIQKSSLLAKSVEIEATKAFDENVDKIEEVKESEFKNIEKDVDIPNNKEDRNKQTVDSAFETLSFNQLNLIVAQSKEEFLKKLASSPVFRKYPNTNLMASVGNQKKIFKNNDEVQTVSEIENLNGMDISVKRLSQAILLNLNINAEQDTNFYPEVRNVDSESESSVTLFSLNFEVPLDYNITGSHENNPIANLANNNVYEINNSFKNESSEIKTRNTNNSSGIKHVRAFRTDTSNSRKSNICPYNFDSYRNFKSTIDSSASSRSFTECTMLEFGQIKEKYLKYSLLMPIVEISILTKQIIPITQRIAPHFKTCLTLDNIIYKIILLRTTEICTTSQRNLKYDKNYFIKHYLSKSIRTTNSYFNWWLNLDRFYIVYLQPVISIVVYNQHFNSFVYAVLCNTAADQLNIQTSSSHKLRVIYRSFNPYQNSYYLDNNCLEYSLNDDKIFVVKHWNYKNPKLQHRRRISNDTLFNSAFMSGCQLSNNELYHNRNWSGSLNSNKTHISSWSLIKAENRYQRVKNWIENNQMKHFIY